MASCLPIYIYISLHEILLINPCFSCKRVKRRRTKMMILQIRRTILLYTPTWISQPCQKVKLTSTRFLSYFTVHNNTNFKFQASDQVWQLRMRNLSTLRSLLRPRSEERVRNVREKVYIQWIKDFEAVFDDKRTRSLSC